MHPLIRFFDKKPTRAFQLRRNDWTRRELLDLLPEEAALICNNAFQILLANELKNSLPPGVQCDWRKGRWGGHGSAAHQVLLRSISGSDRRSRPFSQTQLKA
jgi:hypothetical protein